MVGVAAVLLLVLALFGAGGAWQRAAPIPEARSEVAAATVRGEIAVFGGYLSDGSSSPRIDLYSPRANEWRRLPDLPVGLNHAMAAAAGGRLYVVGGYGEDGRAQRRGWVYDGSRVRELPPMPETRAAAGAAVVGTRLYVAGGVTEGAQGRRLATRLLVLDLGRLRWSTTRGPTPREHLAVTAARGTLYVLAGRLGGLDTNLATFEAFTPGRGWRRLPPVPGRRGGTGAAASGGMIVSAGGERPEGTIASVYGYEIATRRWRRLPDLPTPRHGLGVAASGGRVYAIAGGPVPGLTVSAANEYLEVR